MNPLHELQAAVEARVEQVGGDSPLTLAAFLEIVEEARQAADEQAWQDYMGEDL